VIYRFSRDAIGQAIRFAVFRGSSLAVSHKDRMKKMDAPV
jgi:hypothetical protein